MERREKLSLPLLYISACSVLIHCTYNFPLFLERGELNFSKLTDNRVSEACFYSKNYRAEYETLNRLEQMVFEQYEQQTLSEGISEILEGSPIQLCQIWLK
jgi:hypothetical protein